MNQYGKAHPLTTVGYKPQCKYEFQYLNTVKSLGQENERRVHIQCFCLVEDLEDDRMLSEQYSSGF